MTSTSLWAAGRAAAAYDALAPGYEAAIAEDAWMRRVLHRHHARCFAAGQRVLDAGCGTGLDALALARRGVRVTAVDVSAGMLAVLARSHAEEPGLPVEARQADLADLAVWPEASFDGVVSSFAGASAVDPAAFAAAARRLLRPGGRMVLHLLAPRGAGRRALPDGDDLGEGAGEGWVLLAGRPVRHWALPPLAAFGRFFADGFRLREAYGLGFLWPRRWGRRLPAAVIGPLGRVEARLGRFRPWRDRGR
ncbi:MAG TPA: class I SAM-dependent methyltransferase, partial [Thermoanaerobaculia bacterium]|nr:class I SAM-dependent methyltransferase [Thermoanaerobaculia bacterium]